MLRLTLLSATVIALAVHAPAPSHAQPPSAIALGPHSGAFIALSVANFDRQLSWYRDTIGFTVFSQGTAPNGATRFALLQHGNAMLEILQLPDARPLAEAAPSTKASHQIHGFFKSGFVVAQLDSAYVRVKRMGLPLAYDLGQPPGGPYRSFGLRDPEGNLLQFFGK